MKVRQLLIDESKWTQGAMARSKTRREVKYYSRFAIRFCLLGAINRCYGTEKGANVKVRVAYEIGKFGFNSIANYNDNQLINFSDIRGLIRKLDI